MTAMIMAVLSLRDLLDLAIADAGRANTHATSGAVDEGANTLQIQVPTTLGDIVRVADPATELGTAPANFANLCHKTKLSRASTKTKYSECKGGRATARGLGYTRDCCPGPA
jgi:hypothetical protein